MSTPKRQRTVHVMIRDRATGYVCFESIRVERRKIVLNPTPGICVPPLVDVARHGVEAVGEPPIERLRARSLRLGNLLQERWFGGKR